MEQNETTTTLTVMEQPKLSDQVVSAAVGSVVTIVATVAVSAATQGVQAFIQKRQAKKLAKEHVESLNKE